MARSGSGKKKESQSNKSLSSREALAAYIEEIGEKALQEDESNIHSVIAINQILSNQEQVALIDDELKAQLRDIWLKLKSTGIELVDPPFIFGLPDDFDSNETIQNSITN